MVKGTVHRSPSGGLRPSAFQAEGLRSSAVIRRSWFAARRSPRYGWNVGTPHPAVAGEEIDEEGNVYDQHGNIIGNLGLKPLDASSGDLNTDK